MFGLLGRKNKKAVAAKTAAALTQNNVKISLNIENVKAALGASNSSGQSHLIDFNNEISFYDTVKFDGFTFYNDEIGNLILSSSEIFSFTRITRAAIRDITKYPRDENDNSLNNEVINLWNAKFFYILNLYYEYKETDENGIDLYYIEITGTRYILDKP